MIEKASNVVEVKVWWKRRDSGGVCAGAIQKLGPIPPNDARLFGDLFSIPTDACDGILQTFPPF